MHKTDTLTLVDISMKIIIIVIHVMCMYQLLHKIITPLQREKQAKIPGSQTSMSESRMPFACTRHTGRFSRLQHYKSHCSKNNSLNASPLYTCTYMYTCSLLQFLLTNVKKILLLSLFVTYQIPGS